MPTCTAATFYATACLGFGCLNPRQQKALMMRAKILELQALGGPDYRDDLAPLMNDVAKLRQLTPAQVDTARLGIYLATAGEAGATVPTDTNTLLEQSKCYVCLEDDLDHFLLELDCLLGAHAAQ